MNHYMKSVRLWVSALVVIGLLSGCNDNNGVSSTSLLKPFGSEESYDEFTKKHDFNRNSYGSFILNENRTSNFSDGSGGGDFSRTNLQEEGVDEPDVVKTDGEFLYVVSNKSVHIVDAVPALESHKIAEITVPGSVSKIFLHEKRLVIIYTRYVDQSAEISNNINADRLSIGPISFQGTGVLIADVSNPEAPVTQRHEMYDGWLNAARRVDGTLHLVLEFSPPDISAETKPAALLPKRYRVNGNGVTTDLGALVNAANILHPDNPGWLNFVTVVSLDLAQPNREPGALAYLGDSYTIYTSPQALYIVQRDYSAVSGGDNVSIQPVATSTQIHKFTLLPGAVQASASGIVPGSILNQYSLGEHNGFLRLATNSWNTDTAVYVLEQVDAALEVVGKVENIAPGERLFSARFLGDRGFLVTFLQVDPLFTVDLSNPRAPVVVGELKVPGFSNYLHPISDTRLLSIGLSPNNPQISLFDISDFSEPLLMDKVEWASGEWSNAVYDPLAFNYWAEHRLLALPMDSWRTDGVSYWYENGARVYEVDATHGFISKGQLTSQRKGYTNSARVVFIGDYTYYVRHDQIEVAATALLEQMVASVELISPAQRNDGDTIVSY